MLPILVLGLVVILIDLYVYKGLRILWQKPINPILKLFSRTLFWLIPSTLLTSVVFVIHFIPVTPDPRIFNRYYYIVAFAMMFYLPKLVFVLFHLIDDIVFASVKTANLIKGYFRKNDSPFREKIQGRFKFFTSTGIIIALVPFLAVIYGVALGRFDFRVIRKSIEFENLPTSFDGFRVVHISDLHIGSFYGHEERVRRAVEIINEQDPDVIFFTGDLVNNFTSELDGFIDILSEMKATYGKYSILGNHDYGDYYQWESKEAKDKNMVDMIVAHENMGFRLLLNQWDTISINDEKIAVIGVENWGLPPFPRYGNLEKASSGTDQFPFRILLTHDPSHWDEEVIGHTNIELTLAGHTHGMQVGIETANIKWSPGKFKYPRWGGLYEEQRQYLYVNRGLGYIAFPGRIGMPPEVTVIELQKSR